MNLTDLRTLWREADAAELEGSPAFEDRDCVPIRFDAFKLVSEPSITPVTDLSAD